MWRSAPAAAGVLAGVVAGFATAAAVAWLRPPERAAGLEPLPDSGGAVRGVVVQWDPAAAEAAFPAVRDLLGALPSGCEVTVVAAGRAEFEALRARLGAVGPRLRFVPAGRPITGWARDRFVSARRSGRPVLLAPAPAPVALAARANDALVPVRLGLYRPVELSVVAAPFVFEGGDFVADESHLLTTALVARRNQGTPYADPTTLRAAVARTFGREPILLGEAADDVPDHHLGMYVTPLGGGAVLVGDPVRGLELLDRAAGLTLPDALQPDRRPETLARFARAAADLRRAGLEVIPIPLVPTTTPYVWFTWNNVLLDDRPDGRHVLLPRYGLDRLDRAGADAWRRLGFTVHPIDVSRLHRHGGAVRCIAAVIERG